MQSNGNELIECIHPIDISSHALRTDFNVLRVPLKFSFEKLCERLDLVKRDWPWSIKDSNPLYRSIGLQYSDPENRFSDSVNEAASYNISEISSSALPEYPEPKLRRPFQFYDRRNEAGAVFQFYFDRLLPLNVYRTRLMTIAPGFKMIETHVDGDGSVRLHVPIETNSEAIMEVDGLEYHLPADGSGYLINTSKPHRVWNAGAAVRTHLVSVVYRKRISVIHSIAGESFRRYVEDLHMQIGQQGVRQKLAEAQKKSQNGCELCSFLSAQAYETPDLDGRLRFLCGVCVENICRPIEQVHAADAKEGIRVLRAHISRLPIRQQ